MSIIVLARRSSAGGGACRCPCAQTYIYWRYGWDPRKAAANRAKRRVDFADAALALEDPLGVTVRDPDARGEPRFVTLGQDATGRLVVVVHVSRDATVTIISARRATPRERGAYAS